MTPEQLQRLTDRLADVCNTDDLYELEVRLGPFDEGDPVAARALFMIATMRCRLAGGPAISADTFVLEAPPPATAVERFEIRGRMGTRIVRVGWADGALFGSLHALARVTCVNGDLGDCSRARQRIVSALDHVIDELPAQAVA
jgi:hypothetical protein